jgi:hypothetical protein
MNDLINRKRDFVKLFRTKLKRRLNYYKNNIFDPNVVQMTSRMEALRGLYRGQRCFLLGNGPSLNNMNLDLFKNEIVWGANRCYLLFDRIQWRPKFYTAVDTLVIPDNATEINQLSERLPDSSFFYPVAFHYEGILNSRKNVYWFNQTDLNEQDLPDGMFSLNPVKSVVSVRTVTITMMQLAVFMGFNPIYLIGCDTNYQIPATVQIEDAISGNLVSTEDDPNHFSTSYFGKNKKWHEPHVDRMIFHYEQAKKICDQNGIEINNATVGGSLEVFPRVNYLELF